MIRRLKMSAIISDVVQMKEILKAFKCLGEEVYKTPKQVG